MGTYSSYYLYQKFQIIGNQDPMPVIPLTYSVSGDSLDPQPLVEKLENDPRCGYVPPVEYQYRDIESGYTCVDYDKYTKIVRQRSSDGIYWENVSYSAGTLIEHNSTDCGYVGELYRWVNSGTTCYEGDKYIRIIQQVSYDGINWTNTGQETRGTMIEAVSPDCIEYRWVNMDISTDYICEGTTKYYKQKKQYSTDGGVTWYDVVPAEYQKGELYEYDSEDCGYVPPTPYHGKLKAYYSDSTEYEVQCNSSSTLTRTETTGHSTSFTAMTSAIIGDCVSTIDSYAFYYCTSLTSIDIPNSVTNISENAFYSAYTITSIVIPDSVTSIGNSAFGSCTGLTSATIGSGVTSIGNWAFKNCSGLTSVTIGSGVTTIGEYAFEFCSSLPSIDIPDSVTSIGKYAFHSCSDLTTVSIGSGVTSMGDSVFDECSSLTNLTIANGVTTIGKYAFASCSGLTSIDIPNSVTSIGYGAFFNCSGLTSCTIGSGVTTIGEYAFEECSSLTSVVIPDSVTTISQYAFHRCSGLTSVTIGSGVTNIGYEAFYDSRNITSVTIYATIPPTIGTYVFSSGYPIYVPAASVNTYKSASGWSNYASRIQAIP